MEISTLIYMPPAMIVKKEDDPKQLSKDWKEYINGFKIFLEATEMAGVHVKPEVAGTLCVACIKAKNLLLLAGGIEVKKLFNLISKVRVTDSWEESLDKV